MALAARLLKTADTEPQIPRVSDDPQYAEASALLAAFRERFERLGREKERLGLEYHFRSRLKGGGTGEDTASDAALRWRLEKLQAEPTLSASPPPSSAAVTPAIVAGLEVLKGRTVAPPPDHGERVEELDRQAAVILSAIDAQQLVVDAIADELTYKFAKQLQPEWNALQLEFYRAAQRLCQVTRQVQDFRRATLAAGIRSRSDVLLTPNVRAPLMLGSEDDWHSEITGWRRILESWGLLK
jgi:hypothetical protein